MAVVGFPAPQNPTKRLDEIDWNKDLGKPHIDINAPLDSRPPDSPPSHGIKEHLANAPINDLARYKEVDMVNSPPHYTYVDGIECIDFIEHMPYLRGAAGKYIFRAGRKGDEIEDLEKAIWCLQREVRRLRKEQARDHGC